MAIIYKNVTVTSGAVTMVNPVVNSVVNSTTVSWISPPAGSLGTKVPGSSFNFVSNISVTNPVGLTTYSVISGILPAGTSLNAMTGTITGILSNSVTTNYSFTIRATNNTKNADRAFTQIVSM